MVPKCEWCGTLSSPTEQVREMWHTALPNATAKKDEAHCLSLWNRWEGWVTLSSLMKQVREMWHTIFPNKTGERYVAQYFCQWKQVRRMWLTIFTNETGERDVPHNLYLWNRWEGYGTLSLAMKQVREMWHTIFTDETCERDVAHYLHQWNRWEGCGTLSSLLQYVTGNAAHCQYVTCMRHNIFPNRAGRRMWHTVFPKVIAVCM